MGIHHIPTAITHCSRRHKVYVAATALLTFANLSGLAHLIPLFTLFACVFVANPRNPAFGSPLWWLIYFAIFGILLFCSPQQMPKRPPGLHRRLTIGPFTRFSRAAPLVKDLCSAARLTTKCQRTLTILGYLVYQQPHIFASKEFPLLHFLPPTLQKSRLLQIPEHNGNCRTAHRRPSY